MTKPQTLKGFRDFLPAQMAIRKKVTAILEGVFEKYGFQPLQTPTLEYAEVLTGKYGEEADKLLYLFKDRGDREVGLNYDLTVPTARVMAQYAGQIPLPFKRYQIQPAYRAENPQKGRYRQFTQCDVDILGSASPLADAEILAVISDSLKALDLSNFTIRYNSRAILFGLIEKAGIDKTISLSVLQSLDKLDKKPKAEVEEELSSKGISATQIETLFEGLNSAKEDDFLKDVVAAAQKMGAVNLSFSPFLMRGLDYYTGPIFETVVTEPKIGSVTGGGRFDNLIQQLGGPAMPAVGTTIGLDRICDVIEELNLWPQVSPASQILVTIFNQALLDQSLELVGKLRALDLEAEVYLDPAADLTKQLKYADNKKIPFVVILGEEEAAKNKITLKEMATGEQKTFTQSDLTEVAAYVRENSRV